jgi:hypothetical protein
MMVSQFNGPDEDERKNPGDTQTNPAGVSTEQPAEGSDDAPGPDEGSPEG